MTIARHAFDRSAIERIVREVAVGKCSAARWTPTRESKLVVSISARHCHLTDEHVETLFGKGHKLTPEKPLYQDGFYAAEETVMVVGPTSGGCCPRCACSVRRGRIRRSNWHLPTAFRWASSCRCAPSGKIDGTPGCVLVGPAGVVELKEGVIRAERHVHMNLDHAEHYGVKNGDRMKLRIESIVLARCSKNCWCGPMQPASWKCTSIPTKAMRPIWITRRKLNCSSNQNDFPFLSGVTSHGKNDGSAGHDRNQGLYRPGRSQRRNDESRQCPVSWAGTKSAADW